MERHLTFKTFKKAAVPALIIGVLSLVIFSGVHGALKNSVQRTLLQSGTAAAEQWHRHVTVSVPDLDRVIAGEPLNRYQAYKLRSAISYADVVTFRLFDPDGKLVLTSEALPEMRPREPKTDPIASEVYRNGQVEPRFAHEAGPDQIPGTYVEAYHVLEDEDGRRLGVFKLCVDLSMTDMILNESLTQMELVLPAACAAFYLFPALAFLLRTRQVAAARENVRRLEDYDPLTGLLNRMAFARHLEEHFRHPRTGERGLGLVLIDVDDLKGVNDAGGTELGDACLRSLAEILLTNTRDGTDLVGRTGGDEFLAVIQDVTLVQLEQLAGRIQEAVRTPFFHNHDHVHAHISVGIHLSTGDESSARALNAADIALYHAKGSGKDTLVCYAEGMERRLRERRELEALIRTAIRNDGFQLEFQPIVQRGTGLVQGFEALVRLPDGNGNIVPPARFIPLAEEIGLIDDIGLWVLEQAMIEADAWPDNIMISVNLSPNQFAGGNIAGRVEEILIKTNFPAHRLELEVTETLLLNDDLAIDRQIVGLKQLGVSIAMDDFGTGYSSLGYLLKYGFDKLKVDRSFLEAYEYDPEKHGRIIETIIDLGHNLGMIVTVEGVEHLHQVELLHRLDCDLLQGFYFGRPMSSQAAAEMIEAHHGPGIRVDPAFPRAASA